MLWSCHLSCTVVQPGPFTTGTWNNWKTSTCEPSAQSLESAGRTASSTLKSLTEPTPPALKLNCYGHWVCYVIHMDNHCIARRLLYGKVAHGQRNPGRPQKHYKDTIKLNIYWTNIKPKDLESMASNRSYWRALAHTDATNLENNQCQQLQAAWDRHHSTILWPVQGVMFQCRHCSNLMPPDSDCRAISMFTDNSHWLVFFKLEGQPLLPVTVHHSTWQLCLIAVPPFRDRSSSKDSLANQLAIWKYC